MMTETDCGLVRFRSESGDLVLCQMSVRVIEQDRHSITVRAIVRTREHCEYLMISKQAVRDACYRKARWYDARKSINIDFIQVIRP